MANVPRRHHYVPQVLLKGFAHDGTETGKLHIVDLVRNKTYESTPKGTGKEKDYNLIEVPGKDPAAIENGLFANHIEGPAAPAMEKLRADEPLSSEEQQHLVIFMAMQALRAPSIRETYEAFSTQIMRNHLKLLVAHDERFKESLKADSDFADITPEDVLDWAENHRVAWSATGHLHAQLPAFGPILRSLAMRSWIIVSSTEDFVCTDHPVVTISPDDHPRGFAMTDAKVFMPIGHRHGLLGVSTDKPFWCKQDAAPEVVAMLNTTLLLHATRFVASRSDHFLWRQADGTTATRFALVARRAPPKDDAN